MSDFLKHMKELKKELLDVIACPKCKGSLTYSNNVLKCRKCKVDYDVDEGIPVLMPKN